MVFFGGGVMWPVKVYHVHHVFNVDSQYVLSTSSSFVQRSQTPLCHRPSGSLGGNLRTLFILLWLRRLFFLSFRCVGVADLLQADCVGDASYFPITSPRNPKLLQFSILQKGKATTEGCSYHQPIKSYVVRIRTCSRRAS